MSQLAYRLSLSSLVAVMTAAGICGGSGVPPQPPDPSLASRNPPVETDSALAAYYLEAFGRGDVADPGLDAWIAGLEREARRTPMTQRWLRALSRETSVDFAATLFARTLGRRAENRALQAGFRDLLDRSREDHSRSLVGNLPGDSALTVLFVPGWLYRSHPESGASLAPQIEALRRLGISTRLAPVGENAPVAVNAAIVRRSIVDLTAAGRRIVVVSASKAGAEVARALRSLTRTRRVGGVSAWINIGGVLRGTPLADAALRRPKRWLVGALLALRGHRLAGLESLRIGTESSVGVPGEISNTVFILNYLGVPLSGSVGRRARSGYRQLRDFGPNDGLMLLSDDNLAPGPTVVAFGSDHFLRSHPQEAQTLALLRLTIDALRERGASGSETEPASAAPAPSIDHQPHQTATEGDPR